MPTALDIPHCLALIDEDNRMEIGKALADPQDLGGLCATSLWQHVFSDYPDHEFCLLVSASGWPELLSNTNFQSHFEPTQHYSMLQRGVLGFVSIGGFELTLLTDAFDASRFLPVHCPLCLLAVKTVNNKLAEHKGFKLDVCQSIPTSVSSRHIFML